MSTEKNILCLFDVDNTLTLPRLHITPAVQQTIKLLQQKVSVGVIGGSDLNKIAEQLMPNIPDPVEALKKKYEYVFAENGLLAFHNGTRINNVNLQQCLGEDKCQALINFCLEYMSKLVLPCKRGTFVEFRSGMINVSPIGRSCSQEERIAFNKYDNEHQIREKFVEALYKKFPIEKSGLKFSIGGQISIDIFPIGWDKTYCLQFLNDFHEIHFFGDKTLPGGNDYELFEHERTIGHQVKGPEDTVEQVKKLFKI